MLKFIRKYQLIILAVGGSLLMLVFLLEPILTRLSPSPMKVKVATLDDGTVFNRGDLNNANVSISLLKRVNPRALGPRNMGGLGLDTSSETNTGLHWLLLVEHAQRAGLIGEAGDGAAWISEIAEQEAYIQVLTESQQGLIQDPSQIQARMTELKAQIIEVINRNAALSAGNARGSIDDIYRIMAQARGVYRMLSSVQTLPAFSDVGAIKATHDQLDAVAVNAAVISPDLIASAVPDPSDQELQAFFDEYKAQRPADNDYNIGYTQPTRIQLGWLTLDKGVLAGLVKVDRVELNKIWRQNRDRYPGDFALERASLERAYLDEQATDMLIEADQAIRGTVATKTNTLAKENGVFRLPPDWDANRPTLEQMAEAVVERLSDEFSVSVPTPAITIVGDRWLNARGINELPGYGDSAYRVGSNQIPAYALPQFLELTEPNTTGLDVQKGLPLVDPASTDASGNRYYAVILGVRGAGPADTIEDIGREQVVKDYKSVKAYELLTARVEEFRAAIESNASLAPAVDLAIALSGESTPTPPGVMRNLLVRRDAIDRGRLASRVDPKLNQEVFRSAVLEAADSLDPQASAESLTQDPTAVVVPLPGSRSLALGLVIAPRPATLEQFRTRARSIINATAQRELADAGLAERSPFSFSALSDRYGLSKLDKDDEDGEDAGANQDQTGEG